MSADGKFSALFFVAKILRKYGNSYTLKIIQQIGFFSKKYEASFLMKIKIKAHRNFSFHGIYHVSFNFFFEKMKFHIAGKSSLWMIFKQYEISFSLKWTIFNQYEISFLLKWTIFKQYEISFSLKWTIFKQYEISFSMKKKYTKNLSADIKLLAFMVY